VGFLKQEDFRMKKKGDFRTLKKTKKGKKQRREMESKRIRFGLTYKGGVRFVKEALNGVQVRSIECVSVNELHYVLVTTHRPCTISRISEALKGYNETAEARLELESFNGDDVVTFSKAQGYMQHLFYAPFALAKKSEEGGGQSSYWCWNAEEDSTNTKKRASKELQSDFVESVVTPSEKKRASVTPTREVSPSLCWWVFMCLPDNFLGSKLRCASGNRGRLPTSSP
jgi:hypothetical protein